MLVKELIFFNLTHFSTYTCVDFWLFWAIVFRIREEQSQDLECGHVHKNMLKLRWLIELLHWLELKIILQRDEYNVVTF